MTVQGLLAGFAWSALTYSVINECLILKIWEIHTVNYLFQEVGELRTPTSNDHYYTLLVRVYSVHIYIRSPRVRKVHSFEWTAFWKAIQYMQYCCAKIWLYGLTTRETHRQGLRGISLALGAAVCWQDWVTTSIWIMQLTFWSRSIIQSGHGVIWWLSLSHLDKS